MKPRSKTSPDALALGALKAELAAAHKQRDSLKAQIETGQRRIREGWKDVAARLKKMDVDLPLGADGEPAAADLERAMAEAEGFAIRTRQLAAQQVAACGFDPNAPARERLGQAFRDCFAPKPKR